MCYNLTLKRDNNNDPIVRTAGVDVAKIDLKDIGWYIPHYTPSMENQHLVMKQILDKKPTDQAYHEIENVMHTETNMLEPYIM